MNKVQLQDIIYKWVQEETYNSLSKIDKKILQHTKSEKIVQKILEKIKVVSEKIEGKKHAYRVTITNKGAIVAVRDFSLEMKVNK